MSPPAWNGVLEFWFLGASEADFGRPRRVWFDKDPSFDALIRVRFADLVERALAGGLRQWDETTEGTLARILLLDQFPRNIFRDTARAFAGDAQALRAARQLVADEGDRRLTPVQRWFAYLPFEHAEDLAAQNQGVALFTELAEAQVDMADALHWAEKHRDVIARFGRFPHRNDLLGRVSTQEEVEFLRQPGSRF